MGLGAPECQNAAMELVKIDDASENSFVRSRVPLLLTAWIGANDKATENTWRWSADDSALSYSSWDPFQPDDLFGQDCATIAQSDGDWHDESCGFAIGYVCEEVPPPAPPPPSPAADTACWSSPALQANAPWPMRGLCPLRRGAGKFIGSQVNTVNWTFPTGGDVRSGVAVTADGTILFGSDDNKLYALNPNGSQRWAYPTGGDVRSSPLVTSAGAVIVGSDDDYVYSIDLATGVRNWRYNASNDVQSSPAVAADGTIYIGSDSNKLLALSPGGALLWSYTTANDIDSSPAVMADGTIVFGGDDDFVYALKPDLGLTEAQRLKWKTNVGSDVNAIPAIGPAPDNFIYVRTQGGKVKKLNPTTGAIVASFNGPSDLDTDSSPAIGLDGKVYVGLAHDVYALDPVDLTQEWVRPTGNDVKSSPAIGADGTVYVGSDDKKLYALDPDTGAVVWSLQATGLGDYFRGTPAIAKNGAVLVGNENNRLYSIGSFACSPSHPCDNGMGPCTGDTGCGVGLVCGRGIAERYGLPADFGVCWDPTDCATLMPTDCAGPRTRCGDCCVPQCGTAGTSDSCGHTCQACVAGADTDRDSILDCDEQNDADPWTMPLVFNGVDAEQGNACHATPACGLIDTFGEVQACFAPLEAQRLSSGWSFSTNDHNICNPGFGFEPDWSICHEDFGVKYEGLLRLAGTGKHCFKVEGSVADQCASLFIAARTVSTGATTCVDLNEGIYGFAIFYETTGNGLNHMRIKHCFGGASSCTPTDVLDPTDLLPPGEDPGCAPDCNPDLCGNGTVDVGEECDTALTSFCSSDCSAESTPMACSTDGECPPEQFCSHGSGAALGLDPALSYCLPRDPCETDPEASCGFSGAVCGACTCVPDCGGKTCGASSDDGCGDVCRGICNPRASGCHRDSDCTQGYVCGIGAGPRFGHAAGTNVCIPVECDDDVAAQSQCGTVLSHCGVCPADPSTPPGDSLCDPACGPGYYCSPESTCIANVAWSAPPELDVAPDVPTATVGAVPGSFDVSDRGTAQYTIPIEVPPGRAGMEPRIALQYDSSGGEGFLGRGWSLAGLPGITRCPKTFATDLVAAGVLGTSEDAFCLGGDRLVSVNGTYGADGTEYRTELDGFTKVVSYGPTANPDSSYSGPSSFKAWTKEGRILTFGATEGSRRVANRVAVAWYVSQFEDQQGNQMTVEYDRSVNEYPLDVNNTRVDVTMTNPTAIYYTHGNGTTASRKVQFVYNQYFPSHFTPRRFIAGAPVQTIMNLMAIETYVEGRLIRRYELSNREVGPGWLLDSVRICVPSSAGDRCLPATTFQYEESGGTLAEPVGSDTVGHLVGEDMHTGSWAAGPSSRSEAEPWRILRGSEVVFDFDGDGDDDLLQMTPTNASSPTHRWTLRRSLGSVNVNGKFFSQATEPVVHDEAGNGDYWRDLEHCSSFRVFDFNEDGRDDLYAECAHVKGNEAQRTPRFIFISDGSNEFRRQQLDDPFDHYKANPPPKSMMSDLDGDGRLDYVLGYGTGHCESHWEGDHGFVTCDSYDYHITWRRNLGPGTSGVQFAAPVFLTTSSLFEERDGDGNGTMDVVAFNGILKVDESGAPRYLVVASLGTSAGVDLIRDDTASYMRFDANGDGLADVVTLPREICDWSGFGAEIPFMGLALETGSRYSSYEVFTPADIATDYVGGNIYDTIEGSTACSQIHWPRTFVMDQDNDGRQELYLSPLASGSTQWRKRSLNDGGTGWSNAIDTDIPFERHFPAPDYAYANPAAIEFEGWQHPVPMDIDGDGVKDLVMRSGLTQDPNMQVRFARSRSEYRLKAVADGMGVHRDIEYHQSTEASEPAYVPGAGCDYPQRCLSRPPHVVVAAQTVSGAGGPFTDPKAPSEFSSDLKRRYEYTYEDGRADVRGRGFLGFRIRKIEELIPATGVPAWQSLQETTIGYDLDTQDSNLRMYWRAGRPIVTATTRTVAGSELTGDLPTVHYAVTTNVWELRTSIAGRPYVARKSSTNFGIEDGILVSQDDEALFYDDYGNLTRSERNWPDGGATVVTTIGYDHRASFLANWRVALPDDVLVVGTSGGATSSKRIRLHTNYNDRGLPEVVTRSGAVDPAALQVQLTATSTFDAFGNVDSVALAGGADEPGGAPPPVRETFISFDDEGYFPDEIENGVHRALGGGVEGTQFDHDPRNGRVIFRRDPSGDWAGFTYDGVGRLQWQRDTAGRLSVTAYSTSTLGGASMQIRTSGVAAPETTTELNAFGQPIRSSVKRLAGHETAQEFGYDNRGMLIARGLEHFAGGIAPGATYFQYDELGRIITEQYPWQHADGVADSGTRVHMYASTAHMEVSPSVNAWLSLTGATRLHLVEDAVGARSVETMDDRGNVTAAFDALNQPVLYTYGAFDHLKSTYFQGVQTSIQSDEYGRTTRYQDLDRGVYEYRYTGFGDIGHALRNPGAASEQETSYGYDGLGRVVGSTTPDGSYTWAWDGDGTVPSLIGRLESEEVDSPALGNARSEYAYDGPGGALSEVQKQIRGDLFTTHVGYNTSLGLPEEITYPAPSGMSFGVRYEYDPGNLGQVTRIVQAEDQSNELWALGQLDVFGDVAVAQTKGGVTLERTREPQTGLVSRVAASAGSTVLAEETFAYDIRGLLAVRQTRVAGVMQQQHYLYDELGRLRHNVVSPGVDDEYDYNARGNMIENPTVGTLTYGATAGCSTAGPHAVSATSDGRSFCYDAHGNQELRDGPDGRQEVDYSAFDLPVELREGPDGAPTRVTHFEYDANGERVVREEEAGDRTTYVGDHYREDYDAGSAETTHVAMVPLPDGRTLHVNLDESAPAERYLYDQPDHQGSVVGVMNGVGARVEERAYAPFGATSSMFSGPVKSGYTGHEHDQKQGLINMRGRMYDPVIGRFLTPDPVRGIGNSQGMNPYSYVLNNPLNLVDPTGFEPWTDFTGQQWDVEEYTDDEGIAHMDFAFPDGGAAGVDVGGARPEDGNIGQSPGLDTDGVSRGGAGLEPVSEGGLRGPAALMMSFAPAIGPLLDAKAEARRFEDALVAGDTGIAAEAASWVIADVAMIGVDLLSLGTTALARGLVRAEAGNVVRATLQEVRASARAVPRLPATAGPTGHILPSEVIGKTPSQIGARASELGLEARGPDPAQGRGAYVDPGTGQQRILSHPNASPPHAHVNDPAGQRIDANSNVVPAESPAAHLPMRLE